MDAVCHRADPRLVGQSLFQNVSLPRPFWLSDFHFPLERRALFCFGTHFSTNQILDSLNCGAHSGALRPCRISKTYLSIVCLV